MRLSPAIQSLLRCPVCHAGLDMTGGKLLCANKESPHCFPIVEGIPILLDERSSIFSIDDYLFHRRTFFGPQEDTVRERVQRLVPTASQNLKAKQNYSKLADLLLSESTAPRVLTIGGSIMGLGMESLLMHRSIELVESDISFGPRTMLVCDAHEIPFQSGSFDALVAQAVLEHVVDPYRCAAEIHRVIKPSGIIYAETPFMQEVHGAPYDFTRFTPWGHRRLFREFEEIESGMVNGPGMALAFAYEYFLLSFTESRVLRDLIKVFARLTSFHLRYWDKYLDGKRTALDAAGGYYFLGRRNRSVLSDRELVKLYAGRLGVKDGLGGGGTKKRVKGLQGG